MEEEENEGEIDRICIRACSLFLSIQKETTQRFWTKLNGKDDDNRRGSNTGVGCRGSPEKDDRGGDEGGRQSEATCICILALQIVWEGATLCKQKRMVVKRNRACHGQYNRCLVRRGRYTLIADLSRFDISLNLTSCKLLKGTISKTSDSALCMLNHGI